MKFITVRELRGRSGQVWNKLARERDIILTSNGKPIAILSAVSKKRWKSHWQRCDVHEQSPLWNTSNASQFGPVRISSHPRKSLLKSGHPARHAGGESGGGHQCPGSWAFISVRPAC